MLPISSSSFVHSLILEFSYLISFFYLIVSNIVLLLPNWLLFHWLPFHLIQFLSSLPQYSSSYLLFVYSNNFFVINLPSSSPLLNIPSSFSCLFTSFISHWYSFSNSSITSLAFSKFSFPSQVSDSAVNPFYLTRYIPLIFRRVWISSNHT